MAIDGKTLRHSFDRAASTKAIPMVRAWANRHRLVLGQVKVDDKSNEIIADLSRQKYGWGEGLPVEITLR